MAEAGNYWKREKEEMINSAERMSSKIYELFCELKRNYLFRKTMINELNEIEKGYQEKRFDYFEFQKKSRAITGGKGKDEAVFEYDSYMETLIARINNLNDRVFYAVYKDNSGSRAFEAQEEYADNGNNGQEEIEVESVFPQPDENAQKEEIQEAQTEKKEPVIAEEIIEKNKSEPVVSWGIGKAIAAPFAMIFSAIARIFWLKKRKETRRIKVKPVEFSGMKKKKQEKEYAFSEKGIFSGMLKPFANFRRRIREEEKFIGANNEIPITVELLPEQRNSILETTYLKKEAERIKRIIEKERLYSTYRPTTLAAISNIMVKRISAYLLDSFPDFFKNFYKIIRAANIKMLSNTYINIMVLFTGAAFLLSSIVATIIFFILYNPIYLSILKGLGIGLAASISSFTFFYSYPALEVKRRIRSIKANMPFAVNHMAAVSAAGTPPITIFNLIAKTKEYEEISREFEKIVDYIEVFGFDSTTAIRAVSSTTPYPEFKEMLEGLVSAIQSGADTKAFLKQKSSESMNSYRLELQKYNETLTTYSDIYTGVLIAAPLFFVITLTLVNLLGGKVGGLNITTVMLLGTYMIIPGLNIIFLLFLQASQPEV